MPIDLSGLADAAKSSATDLADKFKALGRADLGDATETLQEYAVPAAQWVASLEYAKLTNDTEAQDRLGRDFDELKANALLTIADAGVQAQSVTESEVGTVVVMLGKFGLAALAAA